MAEYCAFEANKKFEIDNNYKILIVFDINGTLVTRIKKNLHILSNLVNGSICVRPHANQLAKFLNEKNIDYGFWTTQSDSKADSSFNALQKFGFSNAKFLWKSDKCVNNYIKDLSVVAKHYPEYNPNNIIIVDDSEHKIKDKDRFIKVTTFHMFNIQSDNEMIILHDYLNHLFEKLNNNREYDDCLSYMNKNKYNCFENLKYLVDKNN